MRHLRKFWNDRSGAYAIIVSVVMIPALLAIGLAVDYSRLLRAQSHLQNLADGTALALASSQETDPKKLKALADHHISSNFDPNIVARVDVRTLEESDETIRLGLTSDLPTMFMGLANVNNLHVGTAAAALRAVRGSVEVSLVLDNTYSMVETDAKGVRRIDALRKSAAELVNKLMSNNKMDVRVAVVPYADYVNVGSDNRSASWVKVPDDTSTTSERKCTETKEETVCRKRAPSYACGTNYNDGVPSTKYCSGECLKEEVVKYEPPKQTCVEPKTTTKTFHGCIGSRLVDATRLSDGNPGVPYVGFSDTTQKCPAQILPLTKDKATVLAKIAAMSENAGYKPKTYIPAGLIWGLNTLSMAEPYT